MRPVSRREFARGMGAAALLAGMPAIGARAGSGPTGVVELFTSQGCSSCPPADAVLRDLAAEPDVLALGYHVDYWDYLGWKDTLASPENTARQRAYARALGSRAVYTPQAVVNGRDHLNGGKGSAIRSMLSRFARGGQGLTVPVAIRSVGDRLAIAVGDGTKPAGHDTHLTLVYFSTSTPVRIERGENAGRTVTYANAVRSMQTLGMWDGKAMELQLPGQKVADHKADGCAVLVQAVTADGHPGPILGAANLTGLTGA